MPKYYRFISQEELDALKTKGRVKPKHGQFLYALKEQNKAFILPHDLNYDITVEELFESDYERIQIPGKTSLDYIVGTVSEDYLIEFEPKFKPTAINLGWYANDDNTELCLVEQLFRGYSSDEVTAIYSGDLWNWKNITIQTLDDLKP